MWLSVDVLTGCVDMGMGCMMKVGCSVGASLVLAL